VKAFPVSITHVKPQYWHVATISPGLKLIGAPQLEHRISWITATWNTLIILLKEA